MGDQSTLYANMQQAAASVPALTQREADALSHLLGDRNTVESDWPEVRATRPKDEAEAEETGEVVEEEDEGRARL